MTTEAEIEARLAGRLAELGRSTGWEHAAPYVHRHLAEHAAIDRRLLLDLVDDYEFLAAAEPRSLAQALGLGFDADMPEPARVFLRRSTLLASVEAGQRARILELEAELQGLPGADAGHGGAGWQPIWARSKPASFNRALEGHTGSVLSVGFGVVDDTPIIVSGSNDRTVRVWDARTGAPTAILEGHTDRVGSVGFGVVDDTPIIVSGSDDRTVRVWDARTGAPTNILEGHTGSVVSVGFGVVDDTPIIVSGSHDNTVRVWDARTGTVRAIIPVAGTMAVAADGHRLAVGAKQGVVFLTLGNEER
jgi:hypothetical protein